jgi:hypothetical protein
LDWTTAGGAGWNRRLLRAGTATGLIRRVGCENGGMVADDDFGTKACRLPGAAAPRVSDQYGREVDVRKLVVRVGTIGCFGGGAAVGALVPVPPKADTALATEWIVRAAQAFSAFVILLFLLNVVDRGVIQAMSPRAFSTRSLVWPDPVGGEHTIRVVDVTPLESDLRQEVRDLHRVVAELAEAVERVQLRMDVIERRRWWRR